MVTATTGARRWWALGAVMLAVLTVGMDLTVLSVALPTLAGVLKASESDLQWFSSGYALVLAAAMLPAGLLGDRYGRKKVMLGSLALFAAGSLACAYSRTAAEFIGARVLLGLAGAGLVVMAVSALTVLFTEEERPKAVGIWAASNMIAFPIGPILGGWLLSHYWWGWVFLMNVPVAILGFMAVATLVPESSSSQRPGIDTVGVVSSSAGLVGVTYGLIEAGQHGWTSSGALAPLVVGLAVIMGFFFWERLLEQHPGGQPLVDLSLFRSPSFTWGVVLFAVLTLSLIGLLFTMPQYFQGVIGTSPEGSGIRLLPVVGGMLVGLLPAAPGQGHRCQAGGGDRLPRARNRPCHRGHGHAVVGRSVHRNVDGDRRCRHRAHHGDGCVGRPGRAVRRAGRGGLRSSPGTQEHRRPPREHGPGERVDVGIRGPAPTRRPSTIGRPSRPKKRLRRGGRGARPALGNTVAVGARRIRPRHRRGPCRVGRVRGRRPRPGTALPSRPSPTTGPGRNRRTRR